MNENIRSLNNKKMNNGGSPAPRWSFVLLAALLAHQCEEWWGGPGFSAWIHATLGVDLPPSRFLAINTIGFLLFTAGIIAAVRSARFAWIVAAVAALLFLNGVIHLLATAVFATYSPGAVTSALLYLPLCGFALFSMSRSLPKPVFLGAIFTGIAFHALVTLTAFS